MEKLENLKQLVAEMDNKAEFVKEVSDYFGKSYRYVLQDWFQKKWNIPSEKLDKIIEMAQKLLFEQTEAKRKLLIDTGYKYI